MEKFCIVKRRKQGLQDHFTSPLPIQEEEPGSRHDKSNLPQEIISSEEPVFSLNLAPWQSGTIRSGGILSLLGAETPKTLNLNLHKEEDGSIVFNFHLDLDHNLMMLKPDQVCRMMQISRHLLERLVKEYKIKSYKFGRLRRFSLKDIIEALGRASA